MCTPTRRKPPPLEIFKGMTKGRVALEFGQSDYSVYQVVCTVQKNAWVDEATFLSWKTLFDNTFRLKNATGFCFQQCKVL